MPVQPLTESELAQALGALPGWSVENGELTASFRADRAGLPALYLAVAAAEDEANHHARVTILYNGITFAMNTHEAGGAITGRDTALAARISALATEHKATPAS